MMNRAQQRMGGKGEHEIAGAEVFQQAADELLQLCVLVLSKFNRRGIASTCERLGRGANARNQIRQPAFAAKVQLKRPVTQGHDPRGSGTFLLPCSGRGAGHVLLGRRGYKADMRSQLRTNRRIIGSDPTQNMNLDTSGKPKCAAIEIVTDQSLILKMLKRNWIFNDAGHEVTIPLLGKIVPAVSLKKGSS